MHIARLTAFHVRIPLKRTVRHASHSRYVNDTLLIRCELSDGTTGWGEGLPRPYVTGETIDTAWEQLRLTDFASQLDQPARTLPATLEMLDGLTLALLPAADDLKSEISDLKSQISDIGSQILRIDSQPSTLNSQPSTSRDCFGNSVRCAIELSVLDAVCRRAEVPLSEVITLLPETVPIRQSVPWVQYSGVITAMSPVRQIRAAFKQRLYGFPQCKVKVGVEGADDAATLRRVRRVLGRRIDLRIDANEAWSCGDVVEKLEPLRPFGITAVEQPVPHAEVGELADVRKQITVPLMLDESLCSLADGRRAIDEGLCDLFNIRLSKCGGFVNSLRLAAMADRAGLGSQLGCQVGETGILSAAGRHFATSVSRLRYLEGSYDRHLVTERLTSEDLTFGYGGRAAALTAPGLGITVDRTAVARCTVRQLPLMERSATARFNTTDTS